MQRLRILILLFFVTVSIPLAFVLWQTFSGLKQEERSQLAFFSETLFDQMEQELAALVQEEENRAVDDYRYLAAQSAEQLQSPLSAMSDRDYILGYLQNNPDGSLQTPLIADDKLIPEDSAEVVRQLKEANSIFNSKKYSLPRQKPLKTAESATVIKTQTETKTKSSFAERYLSSSKTADDKTYLGRKQQRVEEITAEQVLNIARQEELFKKPDDTAGSATFSSSPSNSATSEPPGHTDNNQTQTAAGDVSEKERGSAQTDEAMSISGKLPFQVELAPFQSVAIRDDQIYIFRRIAVNNQIYRQGFILLLKPLAEHLLNTHYRNQPLAEFTAVELQRKDSEPGTIVQAGIPGAVPRFIAERVFPTPFDFLSVTLSAGRIPPSPVRNALHAAVIVLGVFMFFGLLAIYQSARTIVAMSERRSQFVSSVTHELKTPLTNIQMYTEMLEQGVAGTRRREQEYLSVVSSESARLSGLINNVLELARLEKKQRYFHMEDVRIKDLLAEVKTIMARKLENEGFTLNIQADDITFSCDREVLVQILVNVIENSIKFGRHLDLRKIKIIVDTVGQYARIGISDSGPGIPRGDIKKIFDDFHRVDNDLTRKTGGTGIGLALVRKFVTALGGSVHAANNDGAGCTITLFLRL